MSSHLFDWIIKTVCPVWILFLADFKDKGGNKVRRDKALAKNIRQADVAE